MKKLDLSWHIENEFTFTTLLLSRDFAKVLTDEQLTFPRLCLKQSEKS
jgi:hypothetical protein